jgi:hypothetical protein
MKKYIASLALALLPVATPVLADNAEPALTCKTGPVTQTYGGQPWLVFSCSDEKTVIVVSAPGNPVGSQYYVLRPDGDRVSAMGEGSGHSEISDKAFAELARFSSAELAVLAAKTRAVATTQPP